MKLNIELNVEDLKALVIKEIENRLVNLELDPKDVKIEVKSKQNYKSEWEVADFRATYNRSIP